MTTAPGTRFLDPRPADSPARPHRAAPAGLIGSSRGLAPRPARSRRRDRIGAVAGHTAPGFRIAKDDSDDISPIRFSAPIASSFDPHRSSMIV
jgi:hypothetical protein